MIVWKHIFSKVIQGANFLDVAEETGSPFKFLKKIEVTNKISDFFYENETRCDNHAQMFVKVIQSYD